ncbi:alpha/beta hydrolase [Sediminibacterium sp.]|uniref:alpha/beta hydrolase family protein n=1 Tax=Sediminibacterium sp. TaxID=1917865 RepID=UPI0025D4B38F|nr:alpha/beta hydrolase [Sediminibacterium sp.]MBW0177219.1 alpha/beta hydrolase [Sediminibacterium sp.]
MNFVIRISYALLAVFILITTITGQSAKVTKLSRQPYYRFALKSTSSDSLIFYLSEEVNGNNLPLLVYIQGSGNESLFIKEGDGKIIPRSGHISFAEQAKGRCRLLIIEKPGVTTFQKSGDNKTFDEFFSLQNWQERIKNAIYYTIRNKEADSSRIMIAGHSEGGVVAASLARLMPNLITHITILAGEGLTQLFSLYQLAEQGSFFEAPGKKANERIDSLLAQWRSILKDTMSTSKKFWGFTYLRWSTFLKTSVYDELSGWNGKVLILQGDRDVHVAPVNSKALFTGLLSKGKDVNLEIVEGADHSFNIANSPLNGWVIAIKKSIQWFLSS